MKIFILFVLLIKIATPSVFAQKCSNYACVIDKVKALMQQKEKNYESILDNLDSADGYLTDVNLKEKENIKRLRRAVFKLIENEKKSAIEAREVAEKAQKETNRALAQVEIEKQTAIVEKTKAQAAEAKAKAVLDKIYFYKDELGLAYQDGRYGFIDRDLNIKVDFKYSEALPFNFTGYAKVKRVDYRSDSYLPVDFLVDTTRADFKLSCEINQLDSSLEAIDWSYKDIKEIPFKLFQNKQIVILRLNNNMINLVSDSLSQLTNLQHLSLWYNKLTNIEFNIGKLINLKSLSLGSNRLSKIFVEWKPLKKLQYLSIDKNLLTEIPSDISELKNLNFLGLSENRLTIIPPELGKLSNLKSLYLNRNQISDFPIELCKLENLHILILSENNFTNLPNEIVNLKKLKTLSLSHNPIPKEEQEKIKKLLPNCKIEF